VGITVGEPDLEVPKGQPLKIHEDGQVTQYLHTGFTLRLHEDECESYYHNLMTPQPRCYVMARPDEREVPVPFLVGAGWPIA